MLLANSINMETSFIELDPESPDTALVSFDIPTAVLVDLIVQELETEAADASKATPESATTEEAEEVAVPAQVRQWAPSRLRKCAPKAACKPAKASNSILKFGGSRLRKICKP